MTLKNSSETDAAWTMIDRTHHNMSHHAPSPETQEVMSALREEFKTMAATVIFNTPPGREQSMAITALEDALMYTMAAIARNPQS